MVQKRKKLHAVLYHITACIIGFIMIYPLLWMLMSSFKDNTEIFTDSWSLLPKNWAITDNYASGWAGVGNVGFGTFLKNSIIVSTVATAGNLVCSLMAACAFARLRFRGSKFWFSAVMITMMVPNQVMVVPQYIIFHKLGLINTYPALIIPWFFGGGFFIFLMIQFLRGIPKELDEAAEIDGCTQLQTMTRILIPNVTPAIVTSAIFSFYWIWQDFFQPLIFINDPKLYTVSLGLKLFLDPSTSSNYGGMLAMSTVSVLPIILFFIAFQRHLVEGITTTGLKG
jgi:multiple sugar transport system permease protein